jgi:hypothetical protein
MIEPRISYITHWHAPDGSIVGVTLREGYSAARSCVQLDLRFDDPLHDARFGAWLEAADAVGRPVRDHRGMSAEDVANSFCQAEIVTLHDGPEVQHVVHGVEPVSHAARQIAHERQRRAARRGDSPLPSGGLFDADAHAQQDMFA